MTDEAVKPLRADVQARVETRVRVVALRYRFGRSLFGLVHWTNPSALRTTPHGFRIARVACVRNDRGGWAQTFGQISGVMLGLVPSILVVGREEIARVPPDLATEILGMRLRLTRE